jgi:hypothetical protein
MARTERTGVIITIRPHIDIVCFRVPHSMLIVMLMTTIEGDVSYQNPCDFVVELACVRRHWSSA